MHTSTNASGHTPRVASGTLDPTAAQSLLSMSVSGQTFAVPISEVREILEVSKLTPVPRTPEFVCGMMNLRGSVVPVIDLSVRLGGVSTTLSPRSCIVITQAQDLLPSTAQDNRRATNLVVGMLVDSVHEVFDIPAGALESVPALGTTVEARYLAAMTRAHGQVFGVLALDRVLAPAELGAMIAAHQVH